MIFSSSPSYFSSLSLFQLLFKIFYIHFHFNSLNSFQFPMIFSSSPSHFIHFHFLQRSCYKFYIHFHFNSLNSFQFPMIFNSSPSHCPSLSLSSIFLNKFSFHTHFNSLTALHSQWFTQFTFQASIFSLPTLNTVFEIHLYSLLHIGSEPDFRPNFHFYLRKYLRTLGLAL